MACALTALAVGSSAPVARAASFIWYGADPSSANWSKPLNWNTNSVPPNDGTADILFAGAPVPPLQTFPNVNATWSVRAIRFDDTIGYLLVGFPLTIGDGGLTQSKNTGVVVTNVIVLGADQFWSAAGSLSVGGDISLGAHRLTVFSSTSNGLSLGGVISGSGGLFKSGSGLVSLAGANTYTGGTIISAGKLETLADDVIPPGTLVMSGGTLDLSGHIETVGPGAVADTGISFTGTVPGGPAHVVIGTQLSISTLGAFIDFTPSNLAAAFVTGGPLNLGTTSNTREFHIEDCPTLTNELIISSAIINPGGTVGPLPSIQKTGSGRLSLGGTNTFARNVQVSEGVLRITIGDALGVGGTAGDKTIVQPGAALELTSGITVATEQLSIDGDGWSTSTGALNSVSGENHWNGPISVAHSASIGVASGTLHVGGSIGVPITGSLTKQGVGTLVIESASPNLTSTSVAAGTLQVENAVGTATIPGDVNVLAGATLAGSGAATGHVKVLAQATLSPGASTGILELGRLTLDLLAITRMEIGGTTPGSGHDQVAVTNQVVFGGNLKLVLVGGFVPAVGNEFVLFTYGSATGRFDAFELPALPAGLGWVFDYGPTSMRARVSADVGVDDALPRRHALHAALPNPSRGPVALSCDVAEAATVAVLAYDLGGREVARPVEPAWMPAGRYTMAWAGTDRAGRPLAAGTYFLRLVVNGEPVGRAARIQRLR